MARGFGATRSRLSQPARRACCAAARTCRGFCRSELEMFRRLLAPAGVEREQYLLEGDHRCLYRIRPQP